ncbi:MAG: hypothetical protein ABIS50_16230 [Luteolibacter sp.]|uniref:hypothetical protein n=1 Tax=Luteolibacter sp. TaxID=1962973 RepID=UPI00326429D3
MPIPLVILFVLAVVGGTWWKNTRHMDFMTPPSDTKLAEIRQKVEGSFPHANQVKDPVPEVAAPPPPPPPPEPPKPTVDLGDLTQPLILQNYGDITPQGADHLIELAKALADKGEFQRSLLAWERVIDLTKPDAGQAAAAIAAIKQLRPTLPDWNLKPETAIQIQLQASTGKKLAKTLTPILESVARDLERASSGIVKIKTSVTAGKTNTANKGPVPVALWLNGTGKKAPSTEVLSFTVASPDKLKDEISKTVFLLIRTYLTKSTAYTPPAELGAGENPMEALSFRITRLSWSEFATSLQVPPKKGG